MNLRIPPVALAATALLSCSGTPDPLCTDARTLATLPTPLAEASGIAISALNPGTLWVHNDSEGTPALYALATDGSLSAVIELPAAGRQSDWEDIALGPCPAGTCLYIGDIGDNLHDRTDRAILRIPEPKLPVTGSVAVERFPFTYPDGPQDAEALFVLPDTSVFVISKGRSGPVRVYRYPLPLRPQSVVLEVVQQLTPGLVQLPDLVTGASATHDGRFVAVRSYSHLQLYRVTRDSLTAVWPLPGHDLAPLGEPQGEGVALADDGTVYLVSETGPAAASPPLSRLTCRLP